MKKLIIITLISLFLTGCFTNTKIDNKKEKKNINEIKEEEKKEIVPEYKDLNNTPIGIYQFENNHLKKISTINTQLTVEKDIGLFQIFPSNEDLIDGNNFATNFYNTWQNYNQNNNLHIGFNIKFKKNNEDVSYNILSPENTMDKWEHLMTYLYDDYKNRNKSFYSHIESNEYDESTLFTAIKLQSSYSCQEITDNIYLTVFTYDSEDDFLNGEYRGNSKYTLTILVENNC